MATIADRHASVIKNCNYLYKKFADMERIDWDEYWRLSAAMQAKYINDDEAIQDFAAYRLGITLKDLMVVKEGKAWPIQK